MVPADGLAILIFLPLTSTARVKCRLEAKKDAQSQRSSERASRHSRRPNAYFAGTRTFMQLRTALAVKHNCESKFERENLHGASNGEAGLSPAQTTAKAYQRLRRSPRCRIDVSVQVSVFREGQTTTYWGRAGELGQNGMGATLGGELQIGEVVSIEFPIPLAPYIMKLRAVVRYSKGVRYGFEFLVVPDEHRLVMRQVCEVLHNGS